MKFNVNIRRVGLRITIFHLTVQAAICGLVCPVTAQIETPRRLGFSFISGTGNDIQNWKPGSSANDAWHISRVPLAERFIFPGSQTKTSLDTDKKYLLWAIASQNARGSGALGSVHYLCEYRDVYCLWVSGGGNFELPPAAVVDGCHRYGIKVTGNITFADPTSPEDRKWIAMFIRDERGNFIHARKIAEISKYYGLDGLSVNWEVTGMTVGQTVTHEDGKNFLLQVREHAARIGLPDFEVLTYYVWQNNGSRNFYIRGIAENNSEWFQYDDKPASSMAFINYEWNTDSVPNSVSQAIRLGRSSYDVYKGLTFYGNKHKHYGALLSNKVSVGCWGEALPAAILPEGTALEKELSTIDKVERYVSGPNKDPSNPGKLMPSTYDYRFGDNFGVAAMFPARSVIRNWPFHTNFCEGTGIAFYHEGRRIHTNSWNDMSLKSIMPSWRWWWSSGGKGLQPAIDFDTAYNGGTSLRISGNIPPGDNILRLFKTKLPISAAGEARLTYKVSDELTNQACHLELAVAFEEGSSISSFSYLPLGATTQRGWNTKILSLSAYAGQMLAVVGINLTGAMPNYNVHIGALTLTDGPVAPPTAPTSVVVGQVTTTDNLINARLDWDLPGNPMYNSDAGVDYFEVYQVDGDTQEKRLAGKAVGRGIILRDVPLLPNNYNPKFQVVSVAGDGMTKSNYVSMSE